MAATARTIQRRAVKACCSATLRNGLEEQMELEGRFIAECADSADGREGVDAFLAKRGRPSSA